MALLRCGTNVCNNFEGTCGDDEYMAVKYYMNLWINFRRSDAYHKIHEILCTIKFSTHVSCFFPFLRWYPYWLNASLQCQICDNGTTATYIIAELLVELASTICIS